MQLIKFFISSLSIHIATSFSNSIRFSDHKNRKLERDENKSVWNQMGQCQNGPYINEQKGSSVSICADGSYMVAGSYLGVLLYNFDDSMGDWVMVYDFTDQLITNGFGYYRAVIADDCNTVAIGAPNNREKGYDAGGIQVFSKDDQIWSLVGQAIFGNRKDDLFGYSLDLSEAGEKLIVGATGAGYVEIYEYQSHINVYDKVNELTGNTEGDDSFGYSVAISGEGDRAVVGAPLADGDDQIVLNGYVRVVDIVNFSFVQQFEGKKEEASLGYAVDISQDGSTIAFSSTENGHVIVFKFNDVTFEWEKVGVSMTIEDEHFGASLSLSRDGTQVAAGAPLNNFYEPLAGAAYVFEYDDDEWLPMGDAIYGRSTFDECGSAIAFSSDNYTLVFACPGHDDGGNDSGQVCTYSNEDFTTEIPSNAPVSFPTNQPLTNPTTTQTSNTTPVTSPTMPPTTMPSTIMASSTKPPTATSAPTGFGAGSDGDSTPVPSSTLRNDSIFQLFVDWIVEVLFVS